MPAVVDETVSRAEFLTTVCGSPQAHHGRNQAWFEYASQMGELLNMDVVQIPVYSWACAIGHAIRMASRVTGRHEVLLSRLIDPERLSVIRICCEPVEMARHITIVPVAYDRKTSGLDLCELQAKISAKTAAAYFESPGYPGGIEGEGAEMARTAPRARC